jgi:hypothetical protein
VVATYPKGVKLCGTDGSIGSRDGELYMGIGSYMDIRNGKSLIRWYGAKLTAETEIKLEGKTYQPGAMLTVDKDLNWVEVSSWDSPNTDSGNALPFSDVHGIGKPL